MHLKWLRAASASHATVAQSVEHRFRKAGVKGSSPLGGFSFPRCSRFGLHSVIQPGQLDHQLLESLVIFIFAEFAFLIPQGGDR